MTYRTSGTYYLKRNHAARKWEAPEGREFEAWMNGAEQFIPDTRGWWLCISNAIGWASRDSPVLPPSVG